MSKPTSLSGVVPASVTPFDEQGKVDAQALLRLLRWNMAQGAESFFIGGSSAECFLLTYGERVQMFMAAAELKDEVFLTAHVGAIGTDEAVGFAREAAALGFDVIAATPPFYYGFGSREVYAYYADIAQAAGMPVLIYNFPGNTHRPFNLSDPVTQKLFKSDFIMGVKHTNQEVYQLERIRALNPSLTLMNGFDETMVAGLALGAAGNIGSTFNFMYPHYRRIYDLFRAGRIDEARALQVKANNIMAALCDVGLIPAIKWVLNDMGVPVGEPRRPFIPITEEQGRRLKAVLEENLENY
ncbi:MAG: dihydrodipicolinate synthase family protein [Clostridia bacterium]|nr:dihydrodipicolinate synthase family protein [Clostridia bacterium]